MKNTDRQPTINLASPLGRQQQILSLIKEAGFDGGGVSRADFLEDEKNHVDDWMNKGYNGDMDFFLCNQEKRFDPRVLVPNAKSVISVILSYFPGNPEISTTSPKVSRYAICPDYHKER